MGIHFIQRSDARVAGQANLVHGSIEPGRRIIELSPSVTTGARGPPETPPEQPYPYSGPGE